MNITPVLSKKEAKFIPVIVIKEMALIKNASIEVAVLPNILSFCFDYDTDYDTDTDPDY